MRKMQGRRGFVVNDFVLRLPTAEHDGFSVSQIRKIVRTLNKALVDDLCDDGFVDLPCKMGRILVSKRQRMPYLASDGTIRKPRAQIDWPRTLQARKDFPNEYIKPLTLEGDNFWIKYFPNTHGMYINMTYFDRDFKPERNLIRRIGKLVGENKITIAVERHTRRPMEAWIWKKDTHQ